MSLRYRNNSGEETIIAGLTPGGDIEAGAVASRSGVIQCPGSSSQDYCQVAVTFSDPMPDNDYIIEIQPKQGSWEVQQWTCIGKTITGFTFVVYNVNRTAPYAATEFYYTAIKTYTVQHAQQNAEDLATIQAAMPTDASSINKLTTKAYVDDVDHALGLRVDAVEDLVPAGASITNQLVSHDTLNAGLNLKQNTLTFDTVPSLNSTNPVTSAGIKAAINAADRSATIDKLDACYYNVRFTGTTIEDDLVTLLNTFKTKENGTYYGDFIRVGKNAGTYNLSKYSDATNTFIIGIATSGSQSYSIGVLNNNTPSVLKIVYATTPTISAVAPFRIIKNNRCAEVSTMDGSSISDEPLTAYTWKTNVRALGTIDSNMGESLYVMAPTVYQSGNSFYNGVARVFYSGRVDFWCTESISGSYIPYLNVTLPITE